jgi:hypothetical protein
LVPKHTRADDTVDDNALLAEIGQGRVYEMQLLSVEIIKLVEKQLARLPDAQRRIQELLEVEFDGRKLKHMLVPPYAPIRPRYDARKAINAV